MKYFSNNYAFKILKLFYGELTHKENNNKTKNNENCYRTPLRYLFFSFYNFFNKNKKTKFMMKIFLKI